MKLIKLELQAFGSFKNKETIDFTLFNTNNIFLISGKTGSGKTTIFDAISFALFGKLTGQFKSDDMIRSHYATDCDETYVKLEFIEQNHLYEVYRRPSYRIPNRKTPITASAVLTSLKDNKVLSTKTNETNKLIEDILKFNHEQFKQIVVLPQGEFIKILNSNSNDKEKLLSSLLNTSIYNKIIDKLREENNKLEAKLSNVKAINENTLKKYDNINNIDELNNLLNIKEDEFNKANIKYTNINKELNNLKIEIQKFSNLNSLKIKENELKEELLVLNNKKEEIDKLRKEIIILNNVNTLKSKFDYINTYKELLLNEKNNYNIEVNNFNELVKEYNKLESYNIELTKQKELFNKLNSELGTIKLLEKDLKSIEINSLNINKINNTINQINKEIDILTNNDLDIKLDNITKEIIENKNIITSYDSSKLYSLENILDSYNENIKNYNNYNRLIESNTLLDDLNNKINNEIDKLEISLNNLKNLRTHNLLENFIDLVIDNKPCPLCGSFDHPNIISKNSKVVSNNEIENLEKDLMKLKSESIKNKSIIENNEQLINEFKEKINYELLNLDLNALNNNINIENINKEKYKVAVKNIDILDSKRINIAKNIEANNKLLTSKQGEISLLNQQIENYTNLINEANIKINDFCNGNDLKLIKLNKENEIKELNHRINNLNNDIHRINNQYQNSKINLEKLSKSILDYENRINISNDDINLFMVKNNINIEIYNLYLSKVSDINIINKIITDYDIEYTKIKSLILLNEEKLKGYELVDLSLLETKLKELEENSLIIKHKYDISFESYNVISNDYKNLISLNSSNKETIKKYELINELFRLSNGTYSKISKINLQKYVLGIILDKIIIYANHYLKSFASSRYQLKRINDETSSNRGLDLAIIDAQTGQERSVGSLSGGESFLCALALAIGMSEGISNMSGGIRLENIFIDEGFGSLDNEALDNAIEALMILASSGRMIGIISHVSDIKSRITDVITVEKTKNGSKIIIN